MQSGNDELRIEQAKCQAVYDETKMARKLKELIENIDLMVNDRTETRFL